MSVIADKELEMRARALFDGSQLLKEIEDSAPLLYPVVRDLLVLAVAVGYRLRVAEETTRGN